MCFFLRSDLNIYHCLYLLMKNMIWIFLTCLRDPEVLHAVDDLCAHWQLIIGGCQLWDTSGLKVVKEMMIFCSPFLQCLQLMSLSSCQELHPESPGRYLYSERSTADHGSHPVAGHTACFVAQDESWPQNPFPVIH